MDDRREGALAFFCAAAVCVLSPNVAAGAWCGQTITTDAAVVTLTANETCSGKGLTIRADDVRVYGNGHVITATAGNTNNGLIYDGAQASYVYDVVIRGFEKAVRFQGTSDDKSTNNLLSEATLEDNSQYGVEFAAFSESNTLDLLIVRDNGDEGVHFGNKSYGNVLKNSSVYDNAVEQVYIQAQSGCSSVQNAHFVQNNCISGGQLTLKVDRSLDNVIRGNVFRDAPLRFTAGAKGNQLGQEKSCTSNADCNPADNGDGYCPPPGQCILGSCWGNVVDGTHIQLKNQVPDGGTTVLAANNNTISHLEVINQPSDGDCVVFSGEVVGPLPFANAIRESELSCGTGAFQLEYVSGITSAHAGAANTVCDSVCNGSTCHEGSGDPNGGSQAGDTFGIIDIDASCP